eukprot:scaffold3015_cov122-Cylindrotheca_fusiformis.AAC.10
MHHRQLTLATLESWSTTDLNCSFNSGFPMTATICHILTAAKERSHCLRVPALSPGTIQDSILLDLNLWNSMAHPKNGCRSERMNPTLTSPTLGARFPLHRSDEYSEVERKRGIGDAPAQSCIQTI